MAIEMKITLEIANTRLSRATGLMGRHSLDEDAGMLFKFQHAHNLCFWMQNTYIPLEIAFLDDDGHIFQIESMAPLSTKAIRADRPCKYAMEVNHGWFNNNKVKIGARVPLESLGKVRMAQVQGLTPYDMMGQATQEQPLEKEEITIEQDIETQLRNAEPGTEYIMVYYEDTIGMDLPPKRVSTPTPSSGFEFTQGTDSTLVYMYDHSPDIIRPGKTSRGPRTKSFKVGNIRKIDPIAGNNEPVVEENREMPKEFAPYEQQI